MAKTIPAQPKRDADTPEMAEQTGTRIVIRADRKRPKRAKRPKRPHR